MTDAKLSFLYRLATELLELNRRGNESPLPVEEETIQINDDYSMLAQSLEDLLADDISDEGFAELDSSKVRTELIPLENLLFNACLSLCSLLG